MESLTQVCYHPKQKMSCYLRLDLNLTSSTASVISKQIETNYFIFCRNIAMSLLKFSNIKSNLNYRKNLFFYHIGSILSVLRLRHQRQYSVSKLRAEISKLFNFYVLFFQLSRRQKIQIGNLGYRQQYQMNKQKLICSTHLIY